MLYDLHKIGVLGGHGDGSNAIPAAYAATPELADYREGTAMRQLATALGELPGITNLRPEADNISWKERAARLADAGCDLGVELHTNWSVNSEGKPNSGTMIVIVALYNSVHDVEEQTDMATRLFEPLARSMGLKFSVRTKKGSGEWDYYSFINECNKVSVPYPMIVEHGYHLDFAPDVPGNIALVRQRYEQIVETPSGVTYYRVSAGEYDTREAAEAALYDIKARGYEAIVSQYPRVQVGAYRSLANAQRTLERLLKDGYAHAFITSFEKDV